MYSFLTLLFYVMALPFVMYEFLSITDTRTMQRLINKAENKDFQNTSVRLLLVMQIFYMIWAVFGLFTSQWPLFVLLILISFLNNTKKLRSHLWWNKTDATLSFLLLVFIILNKFHLKVDLLHEMLSILR